ncbi:MAG: glycosyltransferase family 4 protein [Planctomycetota bacterium]|jgi:glycosyltransferase involved in cell wall biosynthesis
MMRICYISLGAFTHIGPYIHYFKNAGHDVHFVSLSPAPDWGVPTYNVGLGKKYSRSEGKWKYPLSMVRARRLVRRLKPDILHTHYVTSCGLTGLICNFHPHITTAHGTDLASGGKSFARRTLIRAVFRHADCVNTVSKDLRKKAIALGTNPEKILVLTPGIDTDRFTFAKRPAATVQRSLRLVSTRRFEKAFDHGTTIKALAIVRSRGFDYHMTFAAGGSLLETVKSQAKAEGLDEWVTFLGGVDKGQIVDLLHNNDVFLSTPLWDGISVALLEAMSTGLFPIVSDLRVNLDWIRDGIDGFVHKVGDPVSLAECIIRVYDNPELASKAAERNRKIVVESANTIKNMKILEGIYEELIRKS